MIKDNEVNAIKKNASDLSSYVKNCGLNKKLKTSLKIFTATRWNSIFIMLNAIIENYHTVHELLSEKQRVYNAKYNVFKTDITEKITNLNLSQMIEIRNFFEQFKVNLCNIYYFIYSYLNLNLQNHL